MHYFICSKLVFVIVFTFRILKIKWTYVTSISDRYFMFELDWVGIGSGQNQIQVGLDLTHSCSGWIGSDMNQFGFQSIWVISGLGLHRVNKILSKFGFNSGHFEFRVKSGQYDFELVRFWFSSISSFESRLVQSFRMLVQVWLWPFGSDQFLWIYSHNLAFFKDGKQMWI